MTETLFALGVGPNVVGRTRYCVHPAAQVARISDVGGTKAVDLARVDGLHPDLIIAVREENTAAQVLELSQRYDVLLLHPVDIPTALDSIQVLGARVGAAGAAHDLAAEIAAEFARLPRADGAPTLYLIWRKPYMAVGGGTYIHALLEHLGLVNAAAVLDGRYPALDETALGQLAPALILASTEPFPFRHKHLVELEAMVPGAPAVLVDGEMFGWHGARMKLAARYFADLVPRLAAIASGWREVR